MDKGIVSVFKLTMYYSFSVRYYSCTATSSLIYYPNPAYISGGTSGKVGSQFFFKFRMPFLSPKRQRDCTEEKQ